MLVRDKNNAIVTGIRTRDARRVASRRGNFFLETMPDRSLFFFFFFFLSFFFAAREPRRETRGRLQFTRSCEPSRKARVVTERTNAHALRDAP